MDARRGFTSFSLREHPQLSNRGLGSTAGTILWLRCFDYGRPRGAGDNLVTIESPWRDGDLGRLLEGNVT